MQYKCDASDDRETDEHDKNLEKTVAITINFARKDLDEYDVNERSRCQALQNGRYQTADKRVYAPNGHADADPDGDREAERQAELDDGRTREILSGEADAERKRDETLVYAYRDRQVDELPEIVLQTDGEALEKRVQAECEEQDDAAQTKLLPREVW